MSEQHANGDGPRGLKNLAKMLHGFAKVGRRSGGGRIVIPSGVKMEKQPRQLCPVCSRVFDFALLPAGSFAPKHALCADCKQDLADGWTIFVCDGRQPIKLRSEVLKADGVAGTIQRISEEDYELLTRIDQKPETSNGLPGQEPASEAP